METWPGYPAPPLTCPRINGYMRYPVHIHSRSAQRKWLSEVYHDNPGWINPVTAAERGIRDGDKIRVKSSVGEIVTNSRVTENIVPVLIAISYHVGRE